MALTPAERQARYRARKRGENVPEIPRKRGYKQTPEHVEKRKRFGPDHHARAERHHIDGNTANNKPGNIAFLCRRCHMREDGRLDAVLANPYMGSRTSS